MRNWLALLLAVVLVLGAWGPAAAQAVEGDIRVFVDGKALALDVPPRVVEGRTLVPMRTVFESLNAMVAWNDTARTVTATRGGATVAVPIGSATAEVNGRSVALDVPAMITRGRTLVPLRFVSEALGLDVAWDDAARTVQVFSPSVVRRGAAPGQMVALVGNEPSYYRLQVEPDAAGSTLVLAFNTEAVAPRTGARIAVESAGTAAVDLRLDNPFLNTVRLPALPGLYTITMARAAHFAGGEMGVHIRFWLEPGEPLQPTVSTPLGNWRIRLPREWQPFLAPGGDWVVWLGGDDLTLAAGPNLGYVADKPASLEALIESALQHVERMAGRPEVLGQEEVTLAGLRALRVTVRTGEAEHVVYAVRTETRQLAMVLQSSAPTERRSALLQAGERIVSTLGAPAPAD